MHCRPRAAAVLYQNSALYQARWSFDEPCVQALLRMATPVCLIKRQCTSLLQSPLVARLLAACIETLIESPNSTSAENLSLCRYNSRLNPRQKLH